MPAENTVSPQLYAAILAWASVDQKQRETIIEMLSELETIIEMLSELETIIEMLSELRVKSRATSLFGLESAAYLARTLLREADL